MSNIASTCTVAEYNQGYRDEYSGIPFSIGCFAYNAMKQHIELGIMVAMAAMMVFATTAYVMPSVYAVTRQQWQGW